MPCWQQLLTRDFSFASFKKHWNILTICIISKSAGDLMECSIYHMSGNGVENRLLSFVCDKHNMSMFIMWSPEDLLQVYCSIYLLFFFVLGKGKHWNKYEGGYSLAAITTCWNKVQQFSFLSSKSYFSVQVLLFKCRDHLSEVFLNFLSLLNAKSP